MQRNKTSMKRTFYSLAKLNNLATIGYTFGCFETCDYNIALESAITSHNQIRQYFSNATKNDNTSMSEYFHLLK